MRNRTKDEPRREQKNYRKSIAEMLKQIESSFGSGSIKATLADYIRLIQLERELITDEPVKAVVVRWNDRIAA